MLGNMRLDAGDMRERFARKPLGAASAGIMVKEQQQLAHLMRESDASEALGAERRPAGHAEQGRRGQRGLYPLGKTEPRRACPKPHRAPPEAPQAAARIGKRGEPAPSRIDEGTVDGDEPRIVADRRDQRRAVKGERGGPVGRSRMIAQLRRCRLREAR